MEPHRPNIRDVLTSETRQGRHVDTARTIWPTSKTEVLEKRSRLPKGKTFFSLSLYVISLADLYSLKEHPVTRHKRTVSVCHCP
jgi:hypothetical protein